MLSQPHQLHSITRIPLHLCCSFDSSNRNKLHFSRGEKPLSELGTWGIGGPCKLFVQVIDQKQLLSAVRHCDEQSMRYIVIGKASNCLFDDLGFDGCVVQNNIVFLEKIEAGLYRAGGGYPVNRLGLQTAAEGFMGLEFAAGIPGTVGGAVYMNAGANGQETADAVESVEVITAGGECQILIRRDLSFGYRSSSFQEMNNLAAITAVTFRLKVSKSAKKSQQEYLERRRITQPLGDRSAGSVFRNPSHCVLYGIGAMLDIMHSNVYRRRITQPLGDRSAGSVFRNPPETGFSAAQLIERVGLKGCRVGGAMISNKHANFFINCGGATSKEMLELIGSAKEAVYRQFDVRLEEEILYIPP